ncbi:MAG: polysaccharide biosynthesis protein [Acidobacteriota bacterium]
MPPITLKIVTRVLLDISLIIISWYFGLLLRFEGKIPAQYINAFLHDIPMIIAVTVVFSIIFRLYNRVWEYASIDELMAIVSAITSAVLAIVFIIYTFHMPPLPKSIYILALIFMVFFIGVSRLWWRLFRDYFNRFDNTGFRVLIVGAGDAGAMLAREIQNNVELGLNAVAFIDDDNAKRGKLMLGLPIAGGRHKIPRLVEKMNIDEIIIAMPSVDKATQKEIINICKETNVNIKILPDIYKTVDDGHVLSHIRDVRMEDLLSRDAVETDLMQISGYIEGNIVLVTGAGGSIGSELCRQITQFKPKILVLLECSENNLFEIGMELGDASCAIAEELVDVKNRDKVEAVFKKYQPHVVFHAAAFKHVPMMERHPDEALHNNVLGTKNVAEMADKYCTKTFILISTDKAVNPTSVMGATKRMAELIIKDINRDSQTRLAAVRFGNVLGSRGSVVPTFMKQIEKGGPVTITHPDMTRYFMTIPEAAELVIQAGALAMGGEIFVLDMGEPVKIADMARDLIRLSGYEPDEDISIRYTGLRPGEKLFEELFSGREEIAATRHDRIFISKKELDEKYTGINNNISSLITRSVKENSIISLINTLVPEYQGTPLTNKESTDIPTVTRVI